MKTLFGISMNTIMVSMLVIFILATSIVVVLALLNPLFFRMGLRNIPRRRAQTILIIVGLMLSTVIITSAFGTGDTISYSIRSSAISGLGYVDEAVFHTSGVASQALVGGVGPISADMTGKIQSAVAANPNADGSMPAYITNAPLQDTTSGQTKAGSLLEAFPAKYPAAFGGLTTTGGASVTLDQLGNNEAYLNKKAGDALNAHPGDTVSVYLSGKPMQLRVRAILQNENLASGALSTAGQQLLPSVVLPLERLAPQQPNTILVSNQGDATSGSNNTDAVTTALRALVANPRNVATAHTLLAAPAGNNALKKLIADPAQAGAKTKLTALQAALAKPGQSDQLKSLLSDPDVISALKSIKDPTIARPLNDSLASISDYSVQTVKKDGLDAADLFGSVFTSIFIVFGLFSIAAGILLIFLIFVMLAAERRAEMGMARAVGTKRRHLIQQFLFEGYVYNLAAALVGIALGVLVGLGMVKIMAFLLRSVDFTIQSHVEPRSLVVAFCLGALVTFLTVVISSFRVSRLNIVAAIRDLPEDFGTTKTLGDSWRRSVGRFPRHPRRTKIRFAFTVVGLLLVLALAGVAHGAISISLLVAMLAIFFWPLIAALIARGPILLVVGALLVSVGLSTKQAFFFNTGASLLVIGASMLLRWALGLTAMPEPIRNRIGYTLAGLTLVVFWLLPFDFLQQFGVPKLDGGIEMFFVSGLMLVIGAVWAVMYNADLIAASLIWLFGRRGSLAPILKMAVTYPMQYKFRTGLTLAMFSLVIFTLMVMSVLTKSTAGSLQLDRDTGGYQIYGAVSQQGAATNNAPVIAANPQLNRAIAAEGGIGRTAVGVRQPGQEDQSWQPYTANVLDTSYLTSTRFALHAYARGYNSSADVWQALRAKPGLAVVDSSLVNGGGGGNFGGGLVISGFKYGDKSFNPARIEIRDNRTGTLIPLTVIGFLDQNASNLGDLTQGIYTGENSFTGVGAPAVAPTTYVYRVAPGSDVHATALLLGKTFLNEGLDVKEAQKQFDTNQAIGLGLNNLLQGFMGLGLIVGIAALGVIAFRSVVERRQQIGMMRAMGFQKSMVRTSFLLESSFVAILGTLLGVLLGLGLARNLVDSIAKDNSSVSLTVPWLQIILIVGAAYIASLITTYLPAWQASRIYPAEALRYE
jgi:putative ABC transport system permease protein